jgi:hypothetical protein
VKHRVEQVFGVQVQKKQPIGIGPEHRLRRSLADDATESRQGVEALGGVEHRARVGQRGLGAAKQRFVAEDAAIACAHDGLERNPEGIQRALEAHFEGKAIRGLARAGSEQRLRFTLGAREPVELRGTSDRLREVAEVERLDEVAERAVLDGIRGRRDRGRAGDEDHGQIAVVVTGGAQEIDTGEPGHLDVAHDRFESPRTDGVERGLALVVDDHLVARLAELPGERPPERLVVIDDHDPREAPSGRQAFPYAVEPTALLGA